MFKFIKKLLVNVVSALVVSVLIALSVWAGLYCGATVFAATNSWLLGIICVFGIVAILISIGATVADAMMFKD